MTKRTYIVQEIKKAEKSQSRFMLRSAIGFSIIYFALLSIVGYVGEAQTLKNGGVFWNTGTANYKEVQNYSGTKAGTIRNSGTINITVAGGNGNLTNDGGTPKGTVLNYIGGTGAGTIVCGGSTGNYTNGGGVTDNDSLNNYSGTIRLIGSLTSTGTFDSDTGEVNYNGSGAQTVLATTYRKLVASNAGVKTLGGTTIVNDTIDITGTASLDVGGQSLTINGANAFPSSGTLTASTSGSTVIYNYAGSQSVRTATYYNLTIQNGGTKTADGSITVNNVLTNTATFDLATNTLSTGASATITNTGGTIQTAGNVTFGATHTIAGTFNYQASSGTQTLGAANYTNLTLSGGSGANGQKNFPSGTIGVSGTYSVSGADRNYGSGTFMYNSTSAQNILGGESYNNLTLDQASLKTVLSSINVSGSISLSNGATIDATTNSTTINYNGTGAQSIVGINYYNLTFSNSHGNAALTLANGGTIRVANTFTNSATNVTYVNTNNTFEYNGSSQTITPFTYYHLTLSGSGTKTINTNMQTNGNVVHQSGTSVQVTSAVTSWQIDGDLTTNTGFVNDGVITVGN